MPRRLALPSILLVCVVVQGIAEEPQASPAQPLVAGPAAVTADISDTQLSAVANRVMMTTACGKNSLADGLKELAKREPRFAIPVAERAGKTLKAGVANFPLRSNNLVASAKIMREGIASKRFPTDPSSITWQLSPRDLNSGRYVMEESDQPVGIITVQAQNTHVESWRRFGSPVANFPGGPVTQAGPGIADGANGSNPLLLPEIGMAEVGTTVAVPLGGGLIEDWDAQIAAMNWRPNDRDPDVAWAYYRSSLERAEKTWPKASVIWTTMPLASSRNTLRNYFNSKVRAYAAERGKPLLDIAAIQSTNVAGHTFVDAEGECSDPALVMPTRLPELNTEGAVRMARAWWWMQANLATEATGK
jgi:hypothetical protein